MGAGHQGSSGWLTWRPRFNKLFKRDPAHWRQYAAGGGTACETADATLGTGLTGASDQSTSLHVHRSTTPCMHPGAEYHSWYRPCTSQSSKFVGPQTCAPHHLTIGVGPRRWRVRLPLSLRYKLTTKFGTSDHSLLPWLAARPACRHPEASQRRRPASRLLPFPRGGWVGCSVRACETLRGGVGNGIGWVGSGFLRQ